jgi:hypothetical protein
MNRANQELKGYLVMEEKTPKFIENVAKLKQWAKEYRELEAADWSSLPDIDLYMDQITGYLNRQLRGQVREERDGAPPVTGSMVNNYVKNGLIDRPSQKKYYKEQLAQLYMLCSMKQGKIVDCWGNEYNLTDVVSVQLGKRLYFVEE